jgi:hypothetical protein
MAGDGRALKREVLILVALVLLVDGVFIAIYYAASAATRVTPGTTLPPSVVPFHTTIG